MAKHIPTQDRRRAAKIKANKKLIQKGFLPEKELAEFVFGKKTTRRKRTTRAFVGEGIKDPAKAAEQELRRIRVLSRAGGFRNPVKNPGLKRSDVISKKIAFFMSQFNKTGKIEGITPRDKAHAQKIAQGRAFGIVRSAHKK